MSNPNEGAVEKAARLNMDLVLPEPHELFVDLDDEKAIDDFEKNRWPWFRNVYPESSVKFTTSKSGNIHAYVSCHNLAPLKPTERIAMQAALGSDPLREMIALQHLRDGYEYYSVFFEHRGVVRRDAIAAESPVRS